MPSLHHRVLGELGLISLYHSPVDTKVLILQRFIRFFAFGGSTIVLALYLRALSISETRIGLFMSLALVSDVLSFFLTLFADIVGRKLVLGGAALLMTLSGVVFAVTGNYWLLLMASVVGVISPTYVSQAFPHMIVLIAAEVVEKLAPSVQSKSQRLRN